MATATVENGAYGKVTKAPKVRQNGGLVKVRCKLVGTSPLLMNAMSHETLLSLHTKEKAAKTAAKPEIREAAESKLHTLADGRPHIPLNAMFATLVNAGQYVRLDGRRQVSSAKSTTLPGAVQIVSRELPLLMPTTDMPARWEVDIQQGRNPNGGEAVCLIRPRFDQWRIDLDIQVDQSILPLATVRQLIDVAGRRIGLLEFRPQRRGPFGMFGVDGWSVEAGDES